MYRTQDSRSSLTPGPSVAHGSGPLFLDPSTARLRAAFRGKPRALTDKLTTVAEAVARLVRNGDYLAIGGFGADRLPTAVVHEIVRQGKQDLSFVETSNGRVPGNPASRGSIRILGLLSA